MAGGSMAKREEISEKEEQAEEGQEQGKRKLPIMKFAIIGVVILVVLGAGIGGTFFFMNKSAAKKTEAAPAIGPTWSMDSLIINLADNSGDRYLKVVMQLEVTSPEASKELDIIKPKLRDSILDLLSSKTYKDLSDNIGKQRVRDEIILRGNSMLMQGKINKVYFTEFVIQ